MSETFVFGFRYRIHKGSEINEIIDIPDVMFNAGRLRQRHFYDEVLLTLTRQSLQEVDSAITQGVSVQFGFSSRCVFDSINDY